MVIANDKPTEKKSTANKLDRSIHGQSRGLSHILSKVSISGVRHSPSRDATHSRNRLSVSKCPSCTGSIPEWAIKCRHCASDVDWVCVNELIPCRPQDKEDVEKKEIALMERPRIRSRIDRERRNIAKENEKKHLQLEKAQRLLEEARLEKERRELARLEKELRDREIAREYYRLKKLKAQAEIAKAKKLKDKEHFKAFLIAAGISCGSIVLVVIGRWLVTYAG